MSIPFPGKQPPQFLQRPNNIAKLIVWNDAANPNGDGTQPSTGTALATWVDLSGSGTVSPTQATAARQPIFTTNVQNGLPGLLYNGTTNQRYYNSTTAILNTAAEFTGFSVSSCDQATADTRCVIETTSNNSFTHQYDNSNQPRVGMNIGTSQSLLASTVESFNVPIVLESIYSNPSIAFQGLLQGVSFGSASFAANLAATTGYNIGTYRSVNGRWFSGYIHEIVIYNRALSSNERLIVRNYLMKKWGIT